MNMKISYDYSKELAIGIRDEVFKKIFAREPSVFLVGAEAKRGGSLRSKLRNELTSHPRARKVDVYYPEDLFDDLLSGKLGRRYEYSLLDLENFLAESVDSVVILLEGPGAIAELGAFSNHQDLRSKLLVVVDKKYRSAKSFIMLGLIKLLQRHDKNSVLFFDLNSPDIEQLAGLVRNRIYRTYSQKEVLVQPNNPINAQDYLLASLFIMEPLNLAGVARTLRAASLPGRQDPTIVARTSLSVLENKGFVSLADQQYTITQQGLDRLKDRIKRCRHTDEVWAALDKFRIKYLNRSLRTDKLRVS